MKTSVFAPLVLFVFLIVVGCGLAIAIPPMPGSTGQMIDATMAQAGCPKCDAKPARLDSITFSRGSNPATGSFTMLDFQFKCPKCGEKFKRREVIKP